jgi:hypothetical protein
MTYLLSPYATLIAVAVLGCIFAYYYEGNTQ